MNKKKLSPAQQALLAAIAGKTLTYRIVSLWRGGVTTRSLFDVRIGGEKTQIKVRIATIDALAATGDVVCTCIDPDNKEYTVVLPEVEAPEVEAPEVQEAQEAPEAPATEDYVTELVDSLISESDIKPQPFFMIKIVESPTLKKWIIFNTLNVEDYYRVVKIAEPYITEICKEWLTNFGTWTAPKQFPKESHIEVSDLYDTKQVLEYIRAKLLVH